MVECLLQHAWSRSLPPPWQRSGHGFVCPPTVLTSAGAIYVYYIKCYNTLVIYSPLPNPPPIQLHRLFECSGDILHYMHMHEGICEYCVLFITHMHDDVKGWLRLCHVNSASRLRRLRRPTYNSLGPHTTCREAEREPGDEATM